MKYHLSLLLLSAAAGTTQAFVTVVRQNPFSSPQSLLLQSPHHYNNHAFLPTATTQHHKLRLNVGADGGGAGGFEWEDPEEYDQGVENPFKKKKSEDGKENENENEEDETMKIDPARLLSPRLNGSNLYFVGMMGSGKSSVGDIVARRMGTYNFLDTDTIIESATSLTIPQIFQTEGEESFRQIEAQVLDQVHAYVRCVVSTGGGIVCRLSNWSKLQTGIVIWLDVDPKVIMKRIEGTDRPLLQTEDPLGTLEKLLEERRGRYSQADVRIEVKEEMDENDTADLIVRELHEFIDNNPPAWQKAKEKAQSEGLDWVK